MLTYHKLYYNNKPQVVCNKLPNNMPCLVLIYWVEALLYLIMIFISINSILLYALALASTRERGLVALVIQSVIQSVL